MKTYSLIKTTLVPLLLLLVMPTITKAQDVAKFGKTSIEKVVKEMTLEEKAKMLVGMGMEFGNTEGNSENQAVVGNVKGKVVGAAGITYSLPRLNIPSITFADGPAGLRIDPKRAGDEHTYYCTAFPVGTSLACSWNTDMVENVGNAIGEEVLEYGVDIWLAPGMNLQKNPLGGRNFEYYSEDPVVSGKIAAATVKGIQSNGVGASLKHFAVNNQETARVKVDAVISERALREIYLKGFEIAVKESKPWTVMSAYNKINGEFASESKGLLTDILRNEWKFEGFVVTDWFAGKEIKEQVIAGNDLSMPGKKNDIQKIIKAVEENEISEDVINRNVKNILNIVSKTPVSQGYKYSNKPDLVKHALVARQAAAEGMVLLKNVNNILPISASKKIALFGNYSYATYLGGTGSGEVNEAYKITIDQGLKQAGFELNTTIQDAYNAYIDLSNKANGERNNLLIPESPMEELNITDAIAKFAAQNNDIAFLTIGRNAGEGRDRDLKSKYYLSSQEKLLLEQLSKAFHKEGKSVVVLLNIDAIIDIANWRDLADAIIITWLPGQEGGNAVADVLLGNVTPSAKLTMTIPMAYEDIPSSTNFPNSASVRKWEETIYTDDIFVGYRYFTSSGTEVAYPFGFGLSYTDFEFKDMQVSSKELKDKVNVSVIVKNTGKKPGKEVVQLYISAPKGNLKKPVRELKAFAKTRLLNPGESQRITLALEPKDFASFDSGRSEWVTEKGTYLLQIGKNASEIVNVKEILIKNEFLIEKTKPVLLPKKDIGILKF